jgi:bacterioferritin-associated ferredoxin
VDGTGSAARFYEPAGVAVDSAGNVYVADKLNSTIRKVTPAGVVTTLAGLSNTFGNGSADGTGSAARFGYLDGVAVDSAGIVYVARHIEHTIRKVTPAGVVTTLAGLAGSLAARTGPGVQRGLITCSRGGGQRGNRLCGGHRNHTIRKITAAGEVTTLAGLAQCCDVNGNPVGGKRGRYGKRGAVFWPSRRSGGQRGQRLCGGHLQSHDPESHPAGVVTTLAGLAHVVM